MAAMQLRTSRLERERGASAVEYSLLVAAIAAVIIVITVTLGTVVRGNYSETCTKVGTEMSQATGNC